MDAENDTLSPEDEEEMFSLGLIGKAEVGLLLIIFAIAGPLNLYSFQRTIKAFRASRIKSSILLLRLNLNAADLITQFIYVPRQIIWMLTYSWYGGSIMCRICSFFSTFSFYLNSFVIVTIAIDRVYGAYNMSSLNAHRAAYPRCRNLMIISWITAMLFSLPQSYIFQTLQPFPDLVQCVPIWTVVAHQSHLIFLNHSIPNSVKWQVDARLERIKTYEQLYSVAHILVLFWFPVIIIVFCYVMVLLILQGHLKQHTSASFFDCFCVKHKEEEYNNAISASVQPNDESIVMIRMREESSYGEAVSCQQQPRTPRIGAISIGTINKAKQLAIRQAAFIILAYLACWSPYNVLSLLNMMTDGERRTSALDLFNCLICANSIANPIIYGVFHKNFPSR